jgi:hypothetical protein
MSQSKNFFKDMPPVFKGIIALIILIVLVVVAYLIYKKLKKSKEDQGLNYTVNDAHDEYTKLKRKGEKLSSPLIAYQQTANGIAVDLKGCESFTTELKVINDITKVVKKPIDWYFLVKVFDVKSIDDCGYGSTSYALPELLKDQLDTGGVYAGIGGGIGSGVTSSSNNLLEEYLRKIGVTL